MSNQRYTPEFKDEAVRQIIERGYSVSEVSIKGGLKGKRPIFTIKDRPQYLIKKPLDAGLFYCPCLLSTYQPNPIPPPSQSRGPRPRS